MNAHELAEERSLALHRAVVEKLRADPTLLEQARARVREWGRSGSVHTHYVEAWGRILAGPTEEIHALLLDTGERGRELRQVTPFAGFVEARERWKIWREVRERMGAAESRREGAP